MGISTLTSPVPGPGNAVGSSDEMIAYVVLRGKATAAKASELFTLSGEMLGTTNLDSKDRALEMLRESQVRIQSSIVSSGNAYASATLGSRYSITGHVDNLMRGLPQLQTVREAIALAESDWPAMLARLENMRSALLNSNGVVVNLSSDAEGLGLAQKHVLPLLELLPTSEGASVTWKRPEEEGPAREGLQVATQVKRSTCHTHTHTDREQHPRHRHIHTPRVLVCSGNVRRRYPLARGCRLRRR